MNQLRTQNSPRRLTSRAEPNQVPSSCLNAYEISFPANFAVPVRTYVVTPIDGEVATHEGRGDIVGVVWDYWRENKHCCRGREYWVLDIDSNRVAVPSSWALPGSDDFRGYSIYEESSFDANPNDPEHAEFFTKLIQDAIKKTLKDSAPAELGTLWRFYGDYCQMPDARSAGDFRFCRRFSVQPVSLLDGGFVVRIAVRTVCLDGRTFDYYYREGKVGELAAMLRTKRADRFHHNGDPIGIYVWCDNSTPHSTDVNHYELAEPDAVLTHAGLPIIEQRKMAAGDIRCRPFKKPILTVPLSKVRLVLHTDITTEQHRETIINPRERNRLEGLFRNALERFEVFGQTLQVSRTPLDTRRFTTLEIVPPAVRVRDEWQRSVTIARPASLTYQALKERAQQRRRAIDRNGFMQVNPINPAVACYDSFGKARANRMMADLNRIMEKRRIEYRFSVIRFRDVEDLHRQVQSKGHDAVIAVLPEHSSASGRPNDTHEQIKKRLEIPSKCIHYDNTLPEALVRVRPSTLDEQGKAELRRIGQIYRLTLDHLLIKHGWMPFECAEPFHYNVQVGIDVGGQRNDTVVVCLGHGFGDPATPLSFHMHRIAIPIGKAEPIPTDALFGGLLSLFEQVSGQAMDAGIACEFNSVLFIRDGAMLGNGDSWNEFDALHRLHEAACAKGLVKNNANWAAAEIHKRAEQWRMLDDEGDIVRNPLVGRCVYDLQRPNEGLLATTGRPYLSQGTAQLLKIVVRQLLGPMSFEKIIRDVAWGADMGLTRPDMGRSLPWVLHGADAGALQASRGYKLFGITA